MIILNTRRNICALISEGNIIKKVFHNLLIYTDSIRYRLKSQEYLTELDYYKFFMEKHATKQYF